MLPGCPSGHRGIDDGRGLPEGRREQSEDPVEDDDSGEDRPAPDGQCRPRGSEETDVRQVREAGDGRQCQQEAQRPGLGDDGEDDEPPRLVPGPYDRPQDDEGQKAPTESLHVPHPGSEHQSQRDDGGQGHTQNPGGPDSARGVGTQSHRPRSVTERQPQSGHRVRPGHDHAGIGESADPAPAESCPHADGGHHRHGDQDGTADAHGAPPPRPQPVTPPPTDEGGPDQRGDLDLGGQGTEHEPGEDVVAPGQGAGGDEQAEHQRVVVGATEEYEEDQGVQHGERECRRRVTVNRPCKGRDTPGDQRDPPGRDQAEPDDRGEDVVSGELDECTRQPLPGRAVGRPGSPPEGVHQPDVGIGAERGRTLDVGVESSADHLTLGRIAVDVPAEQRRHHQHRHGPRDDHGRHVPDGRGRPASQRAHDLEPGGDQECDTQIDEHDAEERGVPGAGGGAGTQPEEPGTGEFGGERRTALGDADQHAGRPHHPGSRRHPEGDHPKGAPASRRGRRSAGSHRVGIQER